MRDPREYLIPDWRKSPDFKPWVSPVVPWEQCSPKRKALLRQAWLTGNLRYKLNPDQAKVYDRFLQWVEQKDRGNYFVFDICRRYGKTYLELVLSIRGAIRGEVTDRNAYWTDSEKMAVRIVQPLFVNLIQDCPPDLRPKWMRSDRVWRWPDGRTMELCGLDDPDAARGRHLDRGNIDEAGFVKRLEYIINSVVDDQMQNRPGAYVIVSSTPPDSADHYYSSHLVPLHRAEGSYVHRTIYDNPMLDTRDIEKIIERRGGCASVSVRRELFAEHLTDPTLAAFPEYQESRPDIIVDLPPPPEHRYCFVSMDPGWVDGTGVVFGYWDYELQRLVIEDEYYGRAQRDDEIAAVIKEKEANLWADAKRWDANAHAFKHGEPAKRWTDVDHRLISDLSVRHGIRFSPTKKDNLAQQLVRTREFISCGKLVISKRCKHLDSHLMSAVFRNDSRRELKRSPDGGHYDLAMALVYMVRNITPYEGRNPKRPKSFDNTLWARGANYREEERAKRTKIVHKPRLPGHRKRL